MKPTWCTKQSPCDYDEASAYCLHRECRKAMSDRLNQYQNALQEILDNYGKVCANFELCKHTSCASSYGAWATADIALRENP